MHALSRRQLAVLVVLTLSWGINWPIMKAGVTGYPPITFRVASVWIGLPVLALIMLAFKAPFRVPRERWGELFKLSLTNMILWQTLAIVALPMLSSGRAAILAYTMPIFAAVLGALLFGQRLVPRAWGGIAAATAGVVLLLWHEFTHLSGRPLGVLLMLTAAAVWGVGTHQLRRTTLAVPTLTLAFWMTAATALVMTALAVVLEHDRWVLPGAVTTASIVYNGLVIFGFAQAAWMFLARSLPPVASSLSVMFIPVLGVFSGALALGEVLHWQDWAAIALVVVAIASVLLPSRARAAG